MIHHESLTDLALIQIVQLSIVIAFGALVGLAVRRRPHVAYAVWLLVFVKALIPPVWSSPVGLFSLAAANRAGPMGTLETPAMRVSDVHGPGAGQRDQVHAEAARSVPSNPPAIAANQKSIQSATQARGFPLEVGNVLLSVWIGGALLALAIPLARSIGVRRYVLQHGIDPPESIMDQLEQVRVRVGLKGHRRVLVSPRQFGPAVVGIFSPLIVLPASLVDGPTPALSAAFSHELIHLRRRDQLLALLQWTATAVWWFYLPIWWVNRQFKAAREASCDEEAIAALNCPPADYAQMLLDVVRGRRAGRGGAFSLGVSPLQISTRRLEHVMDPRTRFHHRTPVLAWAVFCALALALVPGAGLALQSESGANAPVAQGEKPLETMHFSGRVVDADSKQPVEGAAVIVHRFNSSSDRVERRAAADTELKTDASGKFAFDVPPEQQNKHLYLELDVRHPKYASRNGEGYGLSLIKRDLALGNQPWFKEITLRAGEEIAGRLLDWTGKPAANVPIQYTAVAGAYDQRFVARGEDRVDDKTTTDADGRFRFNVTKGAEMGCFWAIPDDNAVLFYNIRDQRGNVGTFRLEPGISIPGTVLTFDGKPVANVGVTLESVETNEVSNAVASRDTETDANGKFKFKPVRPGLYELEVTDRIEDEQSGTYKSAVIPGAFMKQRVIVDYTPGNKFPPVEIRAVEHVVVGLQYLDSGGRPRSGHTVFLFSAHGGESYIKSGDPDANGFVQILVPKGLKDVRVELTNDPYSSLRWRRGVNGGLKTSTQIELGTLDSDVKDLYVVRYEAPVLIVRTVGPDGRPIPNFRPSVTFPDAGPIIEATRWNNGVQGDVGFEKQDDGSWRSEQLLPDVELTISARADGYTAATQKMTLKEKETREVTVQMSKP